MQKIAQIFRISVIFLSSSYFQVRKPKHLFLAIFNKIMFSEYRLSTKIKLDGLSRLAPVICHEAKTL